MYTDAIRYCENCVKCTIAMRVGKKKKPPLHPYSSEEALSNIGHQRDGTTKNIKGQQICHHHAGFLDKVATSIPISRSKGYTNCSASGGRGPSHIWGARGPIVRSWDKHAGKCSKRYMSAVRNYKA